MAYDEFDPRPSLFRRKPPEKPPRRLSWRRWLPAAVAGSIAFWVLAFVVLPFAYDRLGHDFVDVFAVAYPAALILGSVVTALLARARTLIEWVLAFALVAGLILVIGILGAFLALGLFGI